MIHNYLITPYAAEVRFKVKARTILRWTEQDKLPSIKRFGSTFIHPKSIQDYLNPVCPHCHKAFKRTHASSKFCSDTCRKMGHRNLHRGVAP